MLLNLDFAWIPGIYFKSEMNKSSSCDETRIWNKAKSWSGMLSIWMLNHHWRCQRSSMKQPSTHSLLLVKLNVTPQSSLALFKVVKVRAFDVFVMSTHSKWHIWIWTCLTLGNKNKKPWLTLNENYEMDSFFSYRWINSFIPENKKKKM